MQRQVIVSDEFFERLEILLPLERHADGTPSRTDFLTYELPAVLDQLVDNYEQITAPASPDSTLRVYITAGILIPYIAIYTRLINDVIEVVWLSTDQDAR